ncbi:beta strand repeat-containing protein [Sediminibacterium ginsengisoli]|nr:hypothetical protein [Sediminibacterium ginsengisoli]
MNSITITPLDIQYDCVTGRAYAKFNIRNVNTLDPFGYYHTLYVIDFGASRLYGDLASGVDGGEVYWEGAYDPSQAIICSAWGYSDNDAPLIFYYIYPPPNSSPATPTIVSSQAMPLCNGMSTVLTATGSEGSYVWSNGQRGASIIVNTAGVYTVRAESACSSSVASLPFNVLINNSPHAPVIGSSNGLSLCNGQQTILTATSSAGSTIYWNNGAVGNSMSITEPGVYYASQTNECGTSDNSNVLVITTGNTPVAPTVNSSNGVTLCNGESTTLTASSAGGLITWNTGQTGESITVAAPGSYYAWETNDCGSSGASNAIVITAGSAPSAPTVSSSNGMLLCNGNTTVLSASGSGAITWNSGATGNYINVSVAGSYYAVAANNCGSSGPSNTIVIETANLPAAPTLSSSNGTLLCNGASSILAALPSFGGSIRWNTGTSGNSLAVSEAGTYYAYEVNGCGSGSNSSTIAITTANTPVAPVITPSGSQLLCNGESTTLSSSGGNVVWANGATGNSLSTSVAGSYYTYDRNACGNSANSNTVVVTTVVCPTPLPGSSFLVCPGSNKTLDAGADYDSYEWSNGATTRTISVGPGNYTVRVSKQGCYATSAPVTVGYYTVVTPTVSASGPLRFCAGGSVVLSSSNAHAYAWNTGASSASLSVSNSGSYYVTVTDANGCQATSAAVGITVNPLPSAAIAGDASVCQNGTAPSVIFTGSGGTAPYTFTYRVGSGAAQTVSSSGGNSASVAVPTNVAGAFTYTLIGVQESSSTTCSNAASGSVTVNVNVLPTATIAGSTTVCKGSASPSISFTAVGGHAPYTFTYRINGGAVQVISSGSSNSVSISAPTDQIGTYVYSLVSVQEAGSCIATASGIATVTINSVPSALISGTATVCQGSGSPMVGFSGSGGIAPYTFSYRINGGAVQTISTTAGNSVNVLVPTTTSGVYLYELLSVKESSGTACSSLASGSVSVTVRALPTATISGGTEVCRNSTAPSIVFTGNGGNLPYTFSYKINSGELQTITTSGSNSAASVQVPTDAAGTFIYTLVSVQESGGTVCAATASGTATVQVNPLPTASISGSATVCQNSSSPQLKLTGGGATAPYTFLYRINSGSDDTIVSTGNLANVNVPTNVAGSFTYALVGVRESSTTACFTGVTGNATVVVKPQPAQPIIVTNNAHLCNGETATLTISNYVPGTTYTWYRNGVGFANTTTNKISVTEAGSYTVLAISADGCASQAVSDAVIITTGSVTTPVIQGVARVCPGGRTLLTVKSLSAISYDSWRWEGAPPGNAGQLSEDSSFFAEAGQYRVKVSAQGCADSVIVHVTANDTEFPAGQLTITPAAVAYGAETILKAEIVGAVRYDWNLSNDDPFTTNGKELRHRFYETGDSIPVHVKAISARNCISSFATYVKVGAAVTIKLPDNSFAGGVKDWNVFPIPFNSQVKITAVLKRNETVKIDLFLGDGRWLRSWSFTGKRGDNLFTLDNVSDLLPGVIYHITGFYNGKKYYDKLYKQQ